MLWTFYENSIVKKNVLTSNMSSAISLHNGIKDDVILFALTYF